MFVLTKNNFVVYGPLNWNKKIFELILDTTYDITIELPETNNSIIQINDIFKIYPMIDGETQGIVDFYSETNGPSWSFTDTHIVRSFVYQNKSLNNLKQDVKKIILNKRKEKENIGTSVVINDNQILLSTTKEKRVELFQKYSVLEDSSIVQWKHSNGWAELSKLNFKQLVDAVNNHIENQFIWEKLKHQEIDNCQTIDELKEFIANEKLL